MFTFRAKFDRIKKTDRIMLVGLFVVLSLTILVAAVLPKFVYRTVEQTQEQETVEQELLRHPLTGVETYEEIKLPQVYSVMVDNHEQAWPQAGIDQAFLVVEAPVEAGIPRMLAFFSSDQDVDTIGPIRSARPYFLDWASELDALYAHVGGSNAALDSIASGGTFDLNQYWWGEYFWRENQSRYAPHNVFTSSELMNKFFVMREEAGVAPTRLYDVWTFKNPDPSGGKGIGLHIEFWEPVYVVDWKYDTETGRYAREQFGQSHTVESGAQMMSDNVAVVITDIEVIDNVGRREIRTTGEGNGYVLQDGRVIEATWKKPSKSERLKFYDRATSEEIVMNAGIMWIEVVGSEEDVRIE